MSGPTSGAHLGRVIVVIPTYNERDNLAWIVGRVRASVPAADILVVDDGSPDGTGELADELAAADAQVSVLHRAEKAGLGAAYLHGFRIALERGYDVIGEMDADGSHQPEQLPLLLAALEHADLVIGSRWVAGGSVVNWPLSRKAALGGRQHLRPGAARHPVARHHGGLPPLPSYDAGAHRPRQRGVGRLHLPDRPGVPHAPGRPDRRRGADRVRRAGPGRVEDEPRHRHRVVATDHHLGASASGGVRSRAYSRNEPRASFARGADR